MCVCVCVCVVIVVVLAERRGHGGDINNKVFMKGTDKSDVWLTISWVAFKLLILTKL